MNVKQIRERLAAIEAIGPQDPEQGHYLEDKLYIDVLKTIADGIANDTDVIYGSAMDLAKEALKAQDLVFKRFFS